MKIELRIAKTANGYIISSSDGNHYPVMDIIYPRIVAAYEIIEATYRENCKQMGRYSYIVIL